MAYTAIWRLMSVYVVLYSLTSLMLRASVLSSRAQACLGSRLVSLSSMARLASVSRRRLSWITIVTSKSHVSSALLSVRRSRCMTNITNRPVASDTVHDGSLRITFGDGEQTHWMAADAVAAQHLVPFTFDAQGVYSAAGAAKHEYATVDVASTVYKMTPKAGESSIAVTCSTGGAKVSLSQKTLRTVDLVRYSASVLQTSLHVGPTAMCSGAVVLAPFAVTGDPANLFMDVYMGEYVVFTLLSISYTLKRSFVCFSRFTYFSYFL